MKSIEKPARLQFRLTAAQKQTIERAASLSGESVTSFVLSSTLREAESVIREHGTTRLSLTDWDRFAAVLETGAEPAPGLIDAAKDYANRVRRSEVGG
jgi:uncharacterized protein (DUF1778 family)